MTITDLIQLAEQGDPVAQCDLGVAYIMGNGVDVDEHKAFSLFTIAANQGDPPAFKNLGRCYLQGIGTEVNLPESLRLFSKAFSCDMVNVKDFLFKAADMGEVCELAEQGNPNAQFFMGLYLPTLGRTVENSNKSIAYLMQASMQNEPSALLCLAQLYQMGGIVQQGRDLFYAERLAQRAYELGNPAALLFCQDIRHEIADTAPVLLAKIIPACTENGNPQDKYVQDFLNGRLFMKTLDMFADMFYRPQDSANAFRGDQLEGINASMWNADMYGLGDIGLIDILKWREKIFSMTCLEYDTVNMRFADADSRLAEFGEYAVIITDVDEFLRRIQIAAKVLFEKHSASDCWIGYQRVIFNVDLGRERVYSEFNKSWSYAWQKEFRIAIDLAGGKFHPKIIRTNAELLENYPDIIRSYLERISQSRSMLEKYPELSEKNPETLRNNPEIMNMYPVALGRAVDDWSKHTFPGKIEEDTNEDSLKDAWYFEIGDISDFCVVVSTTELVNAKDIKAL